MSSNVVSLHKMRKHHWILFMSNLFCIGFSLYSHRVSWGLRLFLLCIWYSCGILVSVELWVRLYRRRSDLPKTMICTLLMVWGSGTLPGKMIWRFSFPVEMISCLIPSIHSFNHPSIYPSIHPSSLTLFPSKPRQVHIPQQSIQSLLNLSPAILPVFNSSGLFLFVQPSNCIRSKVPGCGLLPSEAFHFKSVFSLAPLV